jgi:hypothetical protein
MLINFADRLKNFPNMDLWRALMVGLVKWREIGWGRNEN